MPGSEPSGYEQALVDSWAEVHKRSAVNQLVLTALERRPQWSGELLAFIGEVTEGNWEVDPRSLYRALRRLEHAGLVTHHEIAATGTGAHRKVYEITDMGRRVLHRYVDTVLSYQRHVSPAR